MSTKNILIEAKVETLKRIIKYLEDDIAQYESLKEAE